MFNILTAKAFLLDAGERAVKTFAQVMLALFSTNSLFAITHVSFYHTLGVAASAAVVSVLTSIVSTKVGPDSTASLVGEPPAAVAPTADAGYQPAADNSNVGGGV